MREAHNWTWIGHIKMANGQKIFIYSHKNGSYRAFNKVKEYLGNSFDEILSKILEDRIYDGLIDEYII